jgi:cytoskeletal protein RodZ
VNDASRENVEGQGAPPVYHPYGDTAPPYDEYADPAVAHGWQNTYDDTVRIEPAEDAGNADLPDDVPDDVGRHERLMRRRRFRMKRRVAVAAGVAGVGIFAVAISGLFGSESSEKEDQEAPKAQQSSSATDEPGLTAPLVDDPSGASRKASDGSSPEASDKASVSPSPSDSRSDESGDSGEPATDTPSTTAAAPTSEPEKGNGNPGRGQGATKRPK